MSGPGQEVYRELARLREQNAELEARVKRLQGLLEPPDCLAGFAGLTPAEARIIHVLHRCTDRTVSYEALNEMTHGPLYEAQTDTLKVHMHRIRRKLGPLGIEIYTVHSIGYRMPPESRAALDRFLAKVYAEHNRILNQLLQAA